MDQALETSVVRVRGDVMTAARGHGLHTCAQAAFAPFHATIRRELGLAAEEVVVCGLSIGYEDTAAEVQRLWLAGKREEAAARVPDELVLKTNLLGTEAMVRARLATLGRLLDLIRALG